MKTSRIIIAIVVLALMASQFILASDQEFDIGDGRRLVLHDDGTYEVVHAQVDTSLVVGSQYVIDMDSTMELALEYAILEDPSVALLGKDLLLSMMQETGLVELIEEQMPDFSMIFLDRERVLFTMEGEDPVEYPYRIASDLSLGILIPDEGWYELGSFDSSFDMLNIPVDDGVGALRMKRTVQR